MVINGFSQGGAGYAGPPLIEISGVSSSLPGNGLEFLSGGNTINGLIINRFAFSGIALVTNGFNVVQGNYIGTDSTGTLARGNTNGGIVLVYSPGNLIGGTSSQARNIVSGNRRVGIAILGSGAVSNVVQGNYIGLDKSGTNALPNTQSGVTLTALAGTHDYAAENIIGGSAPNARNVSSGNLADGVFIGGFNRGISGEDRGADRNRVLGNYIGTDKDGSMAIGNLGWGIYLTNAAQTIIGGTGTEEGNVIAGNTQDGIRINVGKSNVVQGNLIGTDLLGLEALPNGGFGVTILGSPGNTIGGVHARSGNTISGNVGSGIFIAGGAAVGNVIQKNLVGLASDGAMALPNGDGGIIIGSHPAFSGSGASNTIGGFNGVGMNCISGNQLDGIHLTEGAHDNRILGNIVGLSTNAAVRVPNRRHGISIFGGTNNVIGGAGKGAGNLISGNRSNGVFIGVGALVAGSVSNVVQGNRIGIASAGNGGSGVFIKGSSGNWIGGFSDKEGNKIAYNGTNLLQHGHGVVVESGTNNPILGNSIWSNAGRGIHLGTNSFNVPDLQDLDGGANQLQNYPVVTRVVFNAVAQKKQIGWTLISEASHSYLVEFFSNAAPDPSGFGEGQTPIGAVTVMTEVRGEVSFTNECKLTDNYISATATDLASLNTSEFSPVDTDGDALPDAWETRGVDFDEDGLVDLVLTNANPMHKDIYVEIDATAGSAPNLNSLDRVNRGSVSFAHNRSNDDGFEKAPKELVFNPDGQPGIAVHLELDQTNLPVVSTWTNVDWVPFMALKATNFGTTAQITATNASAILGAKRLTHHYCIARDHFPFNSKDNLTAGRGEAFGNDFLVACGIDGGLQDFQGLAAVFMHELGHNLGLRHGGHEDLPNYKPNYLSVMNYLHMDPDIGGKLDYSREKLRTLYETDLVESAGIGASARYTGLEVLVGPHDVAGVESPREERWVPVVGKVDWNFDGNTNDGAIVARDISEIFGPPTFLGDEFVGSEDWSRLQFNFSISDYLLDSRLSEEIPDDLPQGILDYFSESFANQGIVHFAEPEYLVGESNLTAVITVLRIPGKAATVSVVYATLNGTATNGVDFSAISGTLTFGTNETKKTFTIPIINDGVAELPETVRLVLSNPSSGATAGAEATLTILDDDPATHFTVINTNNSGAGSLRQAIFNVNTNPGIAIIDFNIPGSSGLTITPSTALPGISNVVTLDGTTQPGYAGVPIIELNGASAGGADGLRIAAGRSTARALVINRFSGNGINLLTKGQNRIEGCYIGLNRQGALAQGNTQNGISVLTTNNVIGGTTPAARNYISGNLSSGILLSGGGTNNQVLGNVVGLGVDGSDQGNGFVGIYASRGDNTIGGTAPGAGNVVSGNDTDGVRLEASRNVVLGNFIGTTLSGLGARANGSNGIILNFATSNVIGGSDSGAANVISGNGRYGISLSGASGNRIEGNRIGTAATGTSGIPNQKGGVLLGPTSQGNRIGDVVAGAANTIAFNSGPGVYVFSASASNNVIRGNSISSNSFFGFAAPGIDLAEEGAGGVTVNDTNDTDIGANQLQNFPVLTAASNSSAGTFITGRLNSRPNTNYTVDFYANLAPGLYGWGDGQFWIGSTTVTTDAGGDALFTAQTPAIYLIGKYISATATDAAGNTSEFSRCVIASSSIPGRTFTVFNVNDSGEGSLRQAILEANAFNSGGNTIEFNIPGFGVHTIMPMSPLPAVEFPVLIDGYTQPGSSANTSSNGQNAVLLIELNGSLAGDANGLLIWGGNSVVRGLVINRFGSANAGYPTAAIYVSGLGGTQIEGNFIGTDPTGMSDAGNLWRGIYIANSPNTVVGGPAPAQRNVISGNDLIVIPGVGYYISGDGVVLDSSAGSRIEGNLIGTAADAVTPLGNQGFGVRFLQPSPYATVGGTVAGAGNVIAFNGSAALLPSSDCGGASPQPADPQQPDSGGNAVLGNSIHSNIGMGIRGDNINVAGQRGNFPFLGSALNSNGVLTVQGRLNSVSNAPHRIEFYGNDIFETTGYGEGKTFLGWTNVTTDATGLSAFTVVLPVAVSNGSFLTATATDDRNNTSEFSPRLTVGDVLTNVIVVNSTDDVDDGIANATHTSLREAIFAANNHSGVDTIRFGIGSGARTISSPSLATPAVMDATTLDATTQPGFTGKPLIYLDGLSAAPIGLRLYSSGNLVRGFAINGFGYGIYDTDGGNVIEGCYVGTDLTGTANGGYQGYGIFLVGSSNRIGGTTVAARNVISGNNSAGIFIQNGGGNVIQGNFIGPDASGTNRLNVRGAPGIVVQTGKGTVIGGAAVAMRNVIAANYPLEIQTGGGGTLIQGNFIGTDKNGANSLGYSGDGVSISGVEGGNVIKDNLISGPYFTALGVVGHSNRVEGNFIGTDVTGTRRIGNQGLGLGVGGGYFGNVIGGTNAGSRNVISGGYDGMLVGGSATLVQGNFIGTQADGVSPLGNTRDGLIVQGYTNRVGGTMSGEGNVIAFNGGNGISVSAGNNNALLGNSIFSNTGLGIDLGTPGVTVNDAGDADTGANQLQNFPVLTAARNTGAGTVIQGTLNSRSSTDYRLEFFVCTNCHASGYGQGKTFLNATTLATDGGGNAPFAFNHPALVTAGQMVTATATDPDNNTSEFSPCITVVNDTNAIVLTLTTSSPWTLSWPVWAQNYMLERATNLTPPTIWQVMSNGITTNNGYRTFTLTNNPALPASYYRLHRP